MYSEFLLCILIFAAPIEANRSYSKYRQWKPAPSVGNSNTNSADGFNFTLVSYNILAQDLLEEHSHLYTKHSPNSLQWPARLKHLRQEILTLRPDILCLQEVQIDHLISIVNNFSDLNLVYIHKKKTGDRTDGCAILFNKDIFHLVSKRTVEFFQPKSQNLLDRHNVGLIAKLRLKCNPKRTILVATTHLLYNPRREDVRLAQMQLLLAEIDRYSTERYGSRIPTIITGDFNSQPNSATLQLINNGWVNYENLTRHTLEESKVSEKSIGKEFLSPCLGITDTCQHYDILKSNYTMNKTRIVNNDVSTDFTIANADNELEEDCPDLFSTGTLSHDLALKSAQQLDLQQQLGSTFQNKWTIVDYIFYTENNLNLLANYELPTLENCTRMGTIPNDELGSDHLSMGAQFFLSFKSN